MIVAGDTSEGLVEPVEALRTAVPEPVEIAAVAGNHEFYSRHRAAELAAGRQRATEIGVHLVENDVAYSGHLRVIGVTLWTDYLLFGAGMRPPAMREALDRIRDHKRIKWNKDPWQRFRPQEALDFAQSVRCVV